MADSRNKIQTSPPSFCLVAHNAAGAISGGEQGHIGGVERQTSLMARWLAARGYRVSLLTWDEGGCTREVIDGVRVIRMCSPDAGFPGLRFFHPRWTSLRRALRDADADLYYHNCAEYVTGQVALWCTLNRRRFVYSSASDLDCTPGLPGIRKWRVRLLYRYGLRRAERIIVQSRRQRAMLRDGFGLDSTVLPMPCPEPAVAVDPGDSLRRYRGGRVLWVGRVSPEKCPERLLELAGLCPEIQFDLVGPADGSGYARRIATDAQSLRNLTLHGAVPRADMDALYARAACLCCTSTLEGFPNTFLEAWSHGLPIVSTFDPDDLIAGLGLGAAATDVPGLRAGLRRVLASYGDWEGISERARRHYRENHTPDAVMPRFVTVFREALDARPTEGTASGKARTARKGGQDR